MNLCPNPLRALMLISGALLAQGALAAADRLGLCPDGNIELATRAEVTLTVAHFDAWMARMPVEDRAGFAVSPRRIEARLMELLRQAEFASFAEQENLVTEGMENEARALHEHRWANADTETLPRWDCAAQQELVRLAHARVIRNQVLAEMYVQRAVAARLPESLEQLAQERFLVNRAAYLSAETRRVHYLFVSSERHTDARARAQALLEQALAAPESFTQLVEEHTDSENFPEDRGLSPEFAAQRDPDSVQQAIFALAEHGDLHPAPVEVVGGFMLIQLAQLESPRPLTLEEAKPQIIDDLRAEFERNARIEVTNKTAHIPVEVDPDVLAHLRERYANP